MSYTSDDLVSQKIMNKEEGSSLREIADDFHKVKTTTDQRAEDISKLIISFNDTVQSGELKIQARCGNYSYRKTYKVVCDTSITEKNKSAFITRNVPYLFWTHQENGIKARLETEFKTEDTKYEWFLSHERTTNIWNPRIIVYMIFEW